jgi:HKD family nuclease
MIQQTLKLSSELNHTLKNCDEIWVAVALISDSGFKYIQDHISKTAKQNFLVGIGLPSSPKVLSQLKGKEGNGLFKSKIYHKPNMLFHPKVYLIKTGNKLTAYVGSGNCTDGGFDKNLELSVKTDEQVFCNGLLTWFNNLFKFGIAITDEFLQSYSILFERRAERMEQDKNELKIIFPDNNSKFSLDNIDFTNQFFKKEHFAAFEETKPWLMTDVVNQERINVKNKLFKLHDKLYPKIQAKKWDLHKHYVFDDTVSSAVHGQYTSSELGGIWLHYGRDKDDIKAFGEKETPLDFMRLQVIIHKNNIGVWNRIGKDLGSRIDRDYFKSKMSSDGTFRQRFFSIINNLPDDYFIRLKNQFKYVREFTTEQQLTEFVLQDDIRFYFIIGIEFSPDDIKLSETNIVNTVIENFGHLYPTYDLIKYELKL